MRPIFGFITALAIALGACTTRPNPSQLPSAVPNSTNAEPEATPPASPTASATEPAASPNTFTFDVENRSAVGVVVSLVTDSDATMAGFLPGQRGTIMIRLQNLRDGIGVDFQDGKCGLLATAQYPTVNPFTLLIDDASKSGAIRLSTREGVSSTAIPLPSNSLQGCGG